MRPDRGRPGPEAVCPLLWQAAWERASLGSEVAGVAATEAWGGKGPRSLQAALALLRTS